MVTENDRNRKFSYTFIYRSLFISQYDISNYLITWIHKKISPYKSHDQFSNVGL